MRTFVPVLLFLALFSGCARPIHNEVSASPTYGASDGKAVCERSGGTWDKLTHFCELYY